MSSVAERLEILCEVNRRLATFERLDDLLRFATGRVRELFDAEGCALLLVDEEAQEFRFPISSQSASSHVTAEALREVRFPVAQGVAGWVLREGRALHLDDARHDPRFYGGVDATTGTTTQSLLAAPLRTSGGTIGVIEVINPRGVSEGDLGFLEALGSDVAVAHERAAAAAALRAEAVGLRRLARLGGVGLAALGVGVIGAAVVAHGARGLPANELLGEPGFLLGLVVAVGGVALAAAVRRVARAA